MKRFFFILIAVLVLVACAPAPTACLGQNFGSESSIPCTVTTSRAVQLPMELVGMLDILMMVAVTAALKWLGEQINVDLTDRAAEIASAFASILVLIINYFLGLVPAAYDSLLSAFFAFLIVFLGGTGVYALFFRKKVRALPGAVETCKRK